MKKIDDQQVIKFAKKVIKKQGVMAFSMRSLLKESGIAPGTLYRIVRNKSDVLIKIFIDFFSTSNELIIKINQLPLNEKERLLVWLLVSSYQSEIRDFDYGVNFLASNRSVLDNASAESLDELRSFFEQRMAIYRALLQKMVMAGQIKASEEEIANILKNLLMVSRGVHVMASNQLLCPGKGHKVTQSGIILLDYVLNQFKWDNPMALDERQIMIALRTLCDSHHG